MAGENHASHVSIIASVMTLTSSLSIDPKLLVRGHIILELQVVAELLASRRQAIQGIQLSLYIGISLKREHLSVKQLGKDLLPSPGELDVVGWQLTDELLVDEHSIVDHVVTYDGSTSLPQSLYHPRKTHLSLQVILNLSSLLSGQVTHLLIELLLVCDENFTIFRAASA